MSGDKPRVSGMLLSTVSTELHPLYHDTDVEVRGLPVHPKDQNQVVRLGGKYYCPLSHLPSPYKYGGRTGRYRVRGIRGRHGGNGETVGSCAECWDGEEEGARP